MAAYRAAAFPTVSRERSSAAFCSCSSRSTVFLSDSASQRAQTAYGLRRGGDRRPGHDRLLQPRHIAQERGHKLSFRGGAARGHREHAARRPGPRLHPARAAGLSPGHQGRRPRRIQDAGLCSVHGAGGGGHRLRRSGVRRARPQPGHDTHGRLPRHHDGGGGASADEGAAREPLQELDRRL